jgi:hypothetical protein
MAYQCLGMLCSKFKKGAEVWRDFVGGNQESGELDGVQEPARGRDSPERETATRVRVLS